MPPSASLRAGLAACLIVLAVAAPDAARRLGADFANHGLNRRAATCANVFSVSNATAPQLAADAVFWRRHAQYQTIELRLLRRRYAQVQQVRHDGKWRRPRHPLHYLRLRHQYWTATIANEGATGSELPDLLTDDDMAGLTGWPSSIFLDAATSLFAMQDEDWSAGDDVPLAEVATGTLALSGGSIADTDKVTVNAGGTLQLSSLPNMTFNGKFDGEYAPDKSKATMDAGGTLQLFSTPGWSFDAKFDGEFASDTNKPSVDAGGALQLFAAANWSFIAKFDGEFAPQSQVYAASGTLHHTW